MLKLQAVSALGFFRIGGSTACSYYSLGKSVLPSYRFMLKLAVVSTLDSPWAPPLHRKPREVSSYPKPVHAEACSGFVARFFFFAILSFVFSALGGHRGGGFGSPR